MNRKSSEALLAYVRDGGGDGRTFEKCCAVFGDTIMLQLAELHRQELVIQCYAEMDQNSEEIEIAVEFVVLDDEVLGNLVEIVGFSGRDAEKRSDKAPVKFSICTGNDNKPAGGKTPKGDYVRVVGRLTYPEWIGQDGNKRTGVEIVASTFEILLKTKPETQPKPIAARPKSGSPGPLKCSARTYDAQG